MTDNTQAVPVNKYARLPEPPRPEDLRTTHDVTHHPEPVNEDDRERDFMLRTTGFVV
jgi:hypothetical protein